jgi:hypothetical protein
MPEAGVSERSALPTPRRAVSPQVIAIIEEIIWHPHCSYPLHRDPKARAKEQYKWILH